MLDLNIWNKNPSFVKNIKKKTYGITDYKSYRKWTNDKHPIKLDIDNG
jgi:hypothetical protein